MPNRSWLTLAQQALAIRRMAPDAQCTVRRGRTLESRLRVQPTPASRLYDIRIVYSVGRMPQVYVLDPPLEGRDGSAAIPHMYDRDKGQICLHLPEEWEPSMRITETIIPWTSEWLFHYELWRFGGEWLGGGHVPESTSGVCRTP